MASQGSTCLGLKPKSSLHIYVLLSLLSPPHSLCSSHTGLLTVPQHTKPGVAPGPLHGMCPLRATSFPYISTWFPPSPPLGLYSNCHLLIEAVPETPLKMTTLIPLFLNLLPVVFSSPSNTMPALFCLLSLPDQNVSPAEAGTSPS